VVKVMTVVAVVALLALLAVGLARTGRALGVGLQPTEGLQDLLDGTLYGSLGLRRSAGSVVGQLRRQAARLHLGLTPGRVFAPGQVLISVHPDDEAVLAPLERAARQAIAGAVSSSARQHGWRLGADAPCVRIVASAEVRRGRPVLQGMSWGEDGTETWPVNAPAHSAAGAGAERRKRRTARLTPDEPTRQVELTEPEPARTRRRRDTTVALPRRPAYPVVRIRLRGEGWLPQVVELDDDRPTVELGREAELPVSASGVSRRHLRISRAQSGALVEDLDSTNGTWLDGVRLSAPHLLTGPALLRLGADGPTVVVAVSDRADVTGEDPESVAPGASR
jgi:hypothetical protein